MSSIPKKSIGLLGGSFDPAHKGHLRISKISIAKFKLKKRYWVITKKNPFKNQAFYSLSERIKYAKKITKAQEKIKIIYLFQCLAIVLLWIFQLIKKVFTI